MRTMAQKRAEYALERVLLIKDKKDFRSFSAGAPSMILQNGFGQTLSFWLAKGTSKDGKMKENDKHIELFDVVKNWLSLKTKDINNNFANEKDRTKLMKELTTMEQRQYLSAQNETLALLEWVKRFANADLS
ncbi:MAG: type III-B CRISPR module-associated protein Cmr5 [Syntrophaceae bacterium]|nr:type III-B CRISPR module-associated protein Cmr5 [Syntrophaceae bacterium]